MNKAQQEAVRRYPPERVKIERYRDEILTTARTAFAAGVDWQKQQQGEITDEVVQQSPAPSPLRLYSVRAAAELLGVSPDWVYDRMNDGTLRRVELGTSKSKQRIRADDLQRFIEANTYGGVS